MQASDAKSGLTELYSLQVITDALPVLVAYINHDLEYVFVNQTYEDWFGRPRADFIGQPLKSLLTPDIYEAVVPAIREALTGKKSQYQLKVMSRLGVFRHIEGVYAPDFDAHGNVRGVISHVGDITEKKRFEEALKQRQDNDQFLAEAGEALSTNLEIDQVFAALGKILVPRQVDWFGIELLNSEGLLETAAACHRDPSLVSLALQMRKRFPSDPNSKNGLFGVIRSGRSERIEWMSDEILNAVAPDPEYRAVLEALHVRSVAMVPLRVQGQIIGVMNFVRSELTRRFKDDDMAVFEALAYRVGLAVENARLYAETKKQRDRLYEMLMRAPIAISVRRGPDLVYELANKPYLELVGGTRTLLGRKYVDVFPEVPPDALEMLRLCAVEGQRYSEPEFAIELDWQGTGVKTEKIVNLVYEPLLDASGRPDGVISFAFEVTHQVLGRRKIEETAENFRVLTETIPHMVFTAESDGAFSYFNQRWYEYTGMNSAQSFLEGGAEFVHPDDFKLLRAKWQSCVQTGEAFMHEVRLKQARDQIYRWFMVQALPIRHDGRVEAPIEKWFGTWTEIQNQKDIEENLIKARTGAERASLAKSNFLANMSHEIRTPMTAVLGFTELLRDPELSADDKADCVDRIERSGRSLLRLIDDILDISKIEAGQLHLEHYVFSPMEIVTEVIAMLKPQAQQKAVAIRAVVETDIPERIQSDPTRVRQILINLVGNAVKFTKEGQVTVAIRFDREAEKNILSVEVRDTGIGISADDQPKLFSAFVQADDSITRKFGGSGLGLALSRRLAEKLGGHLELVSSVPGEGSVFRAQIDCGDLLGVTWSRHAPFISEPIQMRATGGYVRPSAVLGGLTILLVEDVADNRALIRSYLGAAGASVDVAENGAQALTIVGQKKYDVILMDIQMPVMDGIQATKAMRALGYEGPILALTAHAMQEERAQSLQAGCNDHLTKPIGREELMTQILKHLSRTKSAAKNRETPSPSC